MKVGPLGSRRAGFLLERPAHRAGGNCSGEPALSWFGMRAVLLRRRVRAAMAAAGITPEVAADGFRNLAVPLFEILRRRKEPNPLNPDLPSIHGIGGHVDHTIVRADGVTTERLHTWPNVVGEKIEPDRNRGSIPLTCARYAASLDRKRSLSIGARCRSRCR